MDFPDCEKILCYEKGKVFVAHLNETKWGNHYSSFEGSGDWTHWMPLPEPIEEKDGMD